MAKELFEYTFACQDPTQNAHCCHPVPSSFRVVGQTLERFPDVKTVFTPCEDFYVWGLAPVLGTAGFCARNGLIG